ncbi:phytanoyl-CoA dioxygenase family protein [Horticoccus luteus]|uniref:Phytanoyl-CoA dioxygenase family protein n=1 Tax=Horticoccus luteus TaxID=2862869 RepID=A0A8F9TUP1_9BACT|nr:phytanoyl-CoA dioxygenase family protein [Horticoccus luteus]QYM79426.1 phytanoyl-CoA dioxygenase family protein [Horticoccus luteus]
MVADLKTPVDQEISALAEEFAREGYCVARGLFSPGEVEEIREVFNKMHAEGVPGYYERTKSYDGVENPDDPLAQYPRVMMPHRFNARARHYMLLPRVADRLRAFFGTDPVATQSMFYFKPPGARGQALHQDQFYLLVDPGTCIAAWTAIDDCDAENGGMMIVPKTNDAEISCPETANRGESYTSHLVPVPKGKKAQLAQMKAGDTLFFNGSLIHGSGPNRSKTRFRRAFICHYAAGNVQKISGSYRPLVRMDGSEYEVESQSSGGPCGEGWKGGSH